MEGYKPTMSDTSWEGEASEAPPRKKGMPKWLWFCGGGCLFMLLIGCFAIWSDTIPAIGFLERVELWPGVEQVSTGMQTPPPPS